MVLDCLARSGPAGDRPALPRRADLIGLVRASDVVLRYGRRISGNAKDEKSG